MPTSQYSETSDGRSMIGSPASSYIGPPSRSSTGFTRYPDLDDDLDYSDGTLDDEDHTGDHSGDGHRESSHRPTTCHASSSHGKPISPISSAHPRSKDTQSAEHKSFDSLVTIARASIWKGVKEDSAFQSAAELTDQFVQDWLDWKETDGRTLRPDRYTGTWGTDLNRHQRLLNMTRHEAKKQWAESTCGDPPSSSGAQDDGARRLLEHSIYNEMMEVPIRRKPKSAATRRDQRRPAASLRSGA